MVTNEEHKLREKEGLDQVYIKKSLALKITNISQALHGLQSAFHENYNHR